MNKSVLLVACLALPLAALSADSKEAKAQAAAEVAPAASHATDAHAAAMASKARSIKAGACRKEVTDKGLRDVEYKTAYAECINRP